MSKRLHNRMEAAGHDLCRHGFTLIETLVIIVIIVILVAVLVVAGTRWKDSGKVAKTRTALTALQGLATEYEATTQARVNTDGITPFDWSVARSHNARSTSGVIISGGPTVITESISKFCFAINQIPGIEANFVSVGKDLIQGLGGKGNPVSTTPFIRVVDAWGNVIIYGDGVNPVREASFTPAHNTPFFASAGPDGQWGSSATASQAKDNLYSFEIDPSEAARKR